MKLEFSILLVALVIMNNFLGSVASGHANYTCYSDSLALFTDMSNNGANKTYHICPNTMWSIGDYDSRTNKFVDGDWPVVIMHSDTKVLCGPHGHVADNCTIISKATGVEIINAYYYNKGPAKFLALQNILIQGFTFTGQSTNSHIIYSYYVFLSEVDLTVRDCKFIVSVCDDCTFCRFFKKEHHLFFLYMNIIYLSFLIYRITRMQEQSLMLKQQEMEENMPLSKIASFKIITLDSTQI